MKKKVNTAYIVLAFVAFFLTGCVDSSKDKQVVQLNQEIQQKDDKIKLLTEQLRVQENELATSNNKLNNIQKELEGLKKEMNNGNNEKVAVIQPVNAAENITAGLIKKVVNFVEPFDNFLGNIQVNNSRFWIDKSTILEGIYSLDSLRERDKVSIAYYVRGDNKIVTHIRLLPQ